MAFGASFAFSYWSFHLKIRLYILFSFTWVECQVGIKHRGETGTKYMLQRLIGEELIQEKLKWWGYGQGDFLCYWVGAIFTILALFLDRCEKRQKIFYNKLYFEA